MMPLDLSTINPSDISALRNIVRKVRKQDGSASLWLTWRGELGCPLKITKQSSKNLPNHCAGTFCTRDGIYIRNYGNKQKNAYYHPGGFAGTIIHEWCHRMQWFATRNHVNDWYRVVSHPEQDFLYQRWVAELKGSYAAEAPEEMAAEAFRVLKGWQGTESWENNQYFLEDWFDFFTNDPVFSLLF